MKCSYFQDWLMLKLLSCEQSSGHLALPLYPKEPNLNPAEVYILYSKKWLENN